MRFFIGTSFNQTLSRLIVYTIGVLFAVPSYAAMTATPGINYTGRIMMADGITPVTSANVAFSVAIYDINKNCLLFTESRTLDLSATAGIFSFDIGDGAVGSTPTFKGNVSGLYDLFNNNKAFSGLSCAVPHTGFTALADNEPRLLMVSFDAGDGSGAQNLPALKITPVPSALQAYKVNGYGTGDLLRIDSAVDKTANANTDLSQTQYDEFWRLVKNPTTAYLSSSTSLAGDVTGAFGTNTVVKIQNYAVSATAPTTGQVLTFNGTAWTPTTSAPSGVASVTASPPLSVSGTSTANITISQAGAAADGYLSQTDWNTFNNKQTSALANGKILVGNASGLAEAVTMNGDASIDNAGAVTLANSGVVAGTYSKVSVDAKGRVTVGANLASSDIISMLGYTPVNKAGDVMSGNLSLVSVTSDPVGLVAGDEGKMWYRSDLNTIMYWDGAAAIPLGVAGSGMQSLNGLVATAQSFVVGSAGTNIAISSSGSTHTLDIPTASATNRGALSPADWTSFNNKMGTALNSAQVWVGNSGNAATAVSISGDASIDNTGALSIGAGKITAPMLSSGGAVTATSGVVIAGTTGNLVNFACATSGHVLKWSVTGWTCAFADPSLPTLANGKVWIGNAGNAATEVTLSGDASVDNAGVVSLANSGVTAGTYSKVTVDAKGRVTVGANLASSDIISMLGYTPVNKAGDVMAGNLSLSSVTSDPAGLVAGDEGKMWYRSDLNVVKYWDGSAALSLGVAGAGITNINGLTSGTQSFVLGTAGTDIAISSAGSAHTFDIPTASATNRGALSSTDWLTFNAKQSSTLADAKVWIGNSGNAATAVSISGDATVANTGALTLASSGVTAGTYSKVTVDAKGRVTAGGSLATTDLPSLPDGSIWVGNSGNAATAAAMSGDVTMTNAGVTSLANSGVAAGTYSKVTVDAKGRVTVGANLVSSDIISMLGYTPVNKAGDVMMGNLSLSSVTSDPGGLVAGDEGKMWYRSDLNTIRYWDGASAISLGVAGAGITNMNGLTASTQSFVIGTAGTAPAISSAGSAHTLDIPMASTAAVTAGLISKTDYDAFNAKQSSTLASGKILVGNSGNVATAVTMSGDATIDNAGALSIGAGKITAPMLSSGGVVTATSGVMIAGTTGNLVNFACATSGHVLKWSVTGWTCAFPDASLPTLANGKVWIGNSGNAATEVTMSGDASIDNAGAVTLANSGVTTGTYSKVTVDAKGRVTVGAAIGASDVNSALGYTPVNKAGDTMAGNINMGGNDLTNSGDITMAANKYFGLSANSTNGTVAGQMWYDAGTIKYYDGSTTKSLGVAGAGITSLNGLSAGTQSFVTGSAGTDFNISSAGSAHTFNIPTASASNRGALSSADWTTFNAKQSSTLADAKVWVGNSGNAATAVSISGDATVANTGALTLASSGVTAGTYSKVTVDAKGRVTVGANLASSDIISMLGYTPVNKAGDVMMGNLSLSSVTSDPAGLVAGDEGKMWYRSDLNVVKYWDGASAISLGVAGAGITNMNGLTASTQSFVIGTAGTAPAISSAGSAHTLDIPMASTAAVTAGLISKADYDAFNAKQSSSLASAKIWVGNSGGAATAVTMSGDATIDNAGALSIGAAKITGPMLSSGGSIIATTGVVTADATGNLGRFTCSTTGHVATWSVTGWSCAAPAASLPTLTSANLWVGNSGNAATAVTMSGDATMSNAGAVTLANSGVTAGSYAKVVVDAKGRVTAGQSMSASDITSALTYTPVNKAGDTMAGNINMGGNDITNTGNITMAANKYLGLSANSTNGTVAGQMWYDAGTIKYYDGSVVKSLGVAGAGITTLNGLSTGTQSFVTGSAGTDFNISSAGSAHTFNIPTASASNRGALSSADWTTFNSKMSSSLTSANIWVGNSGNAATAVIMSGDATMSNAGAVTLASSGVTAGSYAKVVVDAKGRVTAGQSMSASDITAALGYTPVNKAGDVMLGNLSLSSVTSDPAGLVAGDEGKMWYRSDLNTIRYWDGAAAVSLGVAGAGITNLNGLAASTQSFVIGTAGTAPAISSAASAHTLNIPMASTTAVTAGLISKTDYDAFNAKQSTTLNSGQIRVGNASNVATAVTMSGDATLSNAGVLSIGAAKITGPMLSSGGSIIATTGVVTADATGNLGRFTCSTTGHVATWSVTGWSCAAPAASLPTLTSANLWVGNSGNAATAVTMSGDATMSNAGAVTLASSGVTAGSYAKVVVDAKGRVTAGQSMSASDITYALTYTPVNKAGDTMAGNINMGGNDITNTGNITMAANKYLGLSANSTNGTVAGQMWYDAGTIKYYDGSTTKSLGVAGAGITSLNGLTAGTQSFVIGTSGNSPAFSSASSAHTLNIPMASTAAVTAGLISKTDYDAFNAKQSSALASAKIWVGNSGGAATAVSISGDATMDNAGALSIGSAKITGPMLSSGGSIIATTGVVTADATGNLGRFTCSTTGHVATWSVTGWSCAAPSSVTPLSSLTAASATNTIDSLNFAQTWNWSTATTQSPMSISANALTTGSLLNLTTSNATVNSTNGLLNVANTGASTNGILARFQANSTAGSGMTVLTSGKVGVGTATPATALHIFSAGTTPLTVDSSAGGAYVSFAISGVTKGIMGYASGPNGIGFYDSSGTVTNIMIKDSGNVGIGTASPNTTLDINGAYSQRGIAAPAVSLAGQGRIYFDSTANKFKVSQNGGAYADLVSAGGGITSLNGLSTATQSFVLGTAGTNIAITSTGSAHTFDIPTASASNRGALSSADWTTFNSKMSSSLTSAQIWVGNSGNAATAVTMSGDATMSNAGAVTLASSGVTAGSYSKVSVDAKGRVIAGLSMTASDITTALGFTPANTSGTFVQNGNSFGADAILGANDAYKLGFETNNSTRMTIDASGNVGIGTSAPNAPLEVNGRAIIGGAGGSSVMITGGNTTSTGSNTVFIGTSAGAANTSGINGTFVGSGAGAVNTSGNGNTFIGKSSGSSNSTGTLNTFVGLNSGFSNTTGQSSVVVGQSAAYENITGSRFVAVGRNAMNSFTAVGSTYNVALGESAMYGTLGSSTGIQNTALGGTSGYSLTTGSNNAFVGFDAGSSVTTGSYNVIIGSNNGSSIATSSNNILIADGAGTERMRINSSGNVGVGTASPGVTLDVNGGVRAGASTGVSTCGLGQANGEGTQRYNYTTHKMEYCDGASWVPVGNSRWVGGLKMQGAANCIWSSNSTSWTNMSTVDNDCNAATVSGGATSPGKYPAITFASLPAGDYELVFRNTGLYGSADSCWYQISDGTNSSGSSYGNYYTVASLIVARFSYATAQSNITFTLQTNSKVGTNSCRAELSNTRDVMEIDLKQL